MNAEDIKALIRRYHVETWEKGNMAFVDELLAPNYSGLDLATGQRIGIEGMKQNIEQGRASSSYVQVTIDDIVVEGEKAAFHWVISGTDPQGKPGKFTGFTMYTFTDGKVTDDYFLGFMIAG
jgi:hypothetical protein